MQVLVLYNSRNGHTRAAADAIAQTARQNGHDALVKSVIEARKTDVEQADMLFIGTWVQGMILFGVRPAGAELWVPALPALAGKPVGIFCTYAFNPRGSLSLLGRLLAERGARVIGQQAFQRRHVSEGIGPFAERVLGAAL